MTLKTQSIKCLAGVAVVGGAFLLGSGLTAQSSSASCGEAKCDSAYPGYKEGSPWGRYTFTIPKSQRFTSSQLNMDRIEYLCGDLDGCQVRLGMYDWDNQKRNASRSGLLYYNIDTGAWRASGNVNTHAPQVLDTAGTDLNGTTEHVMQAWTCFLTDGEYNNRAEGDRKKSFNLLQWDVDNYNADCWITFVD